MIFGSRHIAETKKPANIYIIITKEDIIFGGDIFEQEWATCGPSPNEKGSKNIKGSWAIINSLQHYWGSWTQDSELYIHLGRQLLEKKKRISLDGSLRADKIRTKAGAVDEFLELLCQGFESRNRWVEARSLESKE